MGVDHGSFNERIQSAAKMDVGSAGLDLFDEPIQPTAVNERNGGGLSHKSTRNGIKFESIQSITCDECYAFDIFSSFVELVPS